MSISVPTPQSPLQGDNDRIIKNDVQSSRTSSRSLVVVSLDSQGIFNVPV